MRVSAAPVFSSLLIVSCHLQVTLSGFRSGKFMTLVATNVAARGLDINDVQLIIQVLLMRIHTILRIITIFISTLHYDNCTFFSVNLQGMLKPISIVPGAREEQVFFL